LQNIIVSDLSIKECGKGLLDWLNILFKSWYLRSGEWSIRGDDYSDVC
jgi:hypothetical protein